MKFKDATATRLCILNLPHDIIAELDFIAFDIETREPESFA